MREARKQGGKTLRLAMLGFSVTCMLLMGAAMLIGYFVGQLVLLTSLRRRLERTLRKTLSLQNPPADSRHET